MIQHPTSLPGVRLFELSRFGDDRGWFIETYQEERYRAAGLTAHFVQDSVSHSAKGIVRGFHYQLEHPQGKLISALRGEIYDVTLDIRVGSPTFGQWFAVSLSEQNNRQLFVPEGFAHAFCVVSETADVAYKMTAAYVAGDQRGIAWNDPALAIPWPVADPLLSPKDAAAPRLAEATAKLPRWMP